jgi:hypothetical protein
MQPVVDKIADLLFSMIASQVRKEDRRYALPSGQGWLVQEGR